MPAECSGRAALNDLRPVSSNLTSPRALPRYAQGAGHYSATKSCTCSISKADLDIASHEAAESVHVRCHVNHHAAAEVARCVRYAIQAAPRTAKRTTGGLA